MNINRMSIAANERLILRTLCRLAGVAHTMGWRN